MVNFLSSLALFGSCVITIEHLRPRLCLNVSCNDVFCKMRDPKVRDYKQVIPRVIESILRLQIAMNDSQNMGGFYSIQHLNEQNQDSILRNPLF